MTVYFILEIIILFLRRLKNINIYLLLYVIFVIFSGFRDFTVGTDTMNYYMSYGSIYGDYSFNEEIGFVLFRTLFSIMGASYRQFLVIESVLFYIPIFYVIYKKCQKPVFAIFLFLSLGYCFLFFNVQRQMLALSFLTLAYYLYDKDKRKAIPFVLIIVASLFHSLAILFLILFIIDRIKFKATSASVLLLSSFVLPFILPIDQIINSIINSVPFLSRYTYYMDGILEATFSINRLLLNILFIFLISGSSDAVHDRSCKLFLLGLIMLNLFPVTGVIKRMSEYYMFFQIFYLEKKAHSSNIKRLSIITYSVLVFVVYLLNNNGGCVPYLFDWSFR